jgi:hypothetical protein
MFIFTVMMSMVANAQSFSKADAEELAGLNFDWSVETVKAAPATSTTTARRSTRSVSVRQLSAASARKNSTTATRTSTRRAASAPVAQQQYSVAQNVVPQNDLQGQLNNAIAANTNQQVIVGTVEHNYIEDINGTTTLVINTGYQLLYFTMKGYRNYVIPVYAGDYVAFVVTYGMNSMNEYPIVNYSELINVTGTNRHMEKMLMNRYGGNMSVMMANMPNATKWQKVASNITAGIFTVASIAQGVKIVRDLFR